MHYDLPADAKAYVHRSGRTARAGASGVVVTFVGPDQMKATRDLVRPIGVKADITSPDLKALHAAAGTTVAFIDAAKAPREMTREAPPGARRPRGNHARGRSRAAATRGRRPSAGNGKQRRSA